MWIWEDAYAALILRLLEGGWPWLWTKRICRGAEAPSDLLKAAFMAQTWPWGGPCSRDGVVALRSAKLVVDLRKENDIRSRRGGALSRDGRAVLRGRLSREGGRGLRVRCRSGIGVEGEGVMPEERVSDRTLLRSYYDQLALDFSRERGDTMQ